MTERFLESFFFFFFFVGDDESRGATKVNWFVIFDVSIQYF